MQNDNHNKYEPGEILDLNVSYIVLAVPEDTVEVDIKAKIYYDGEVHEVGRHMDFPEVREAMKEADNGYIPGDALFVLAPTKREKLQEMLDRVAEEWDDLEED